MNIIGSYRSMAQIFTTPQSVLTDGVLSDGYLSGSTGSICKTIERLPFAPMGVSILNEIMSAVMMSFEKTYSMATSPFASSMFFIGRGRKASRDEAIQQWASNEKLSSNQYHEESPGTF